ncbi:hypothetical protein M9458_047689, partial [Cirrhinus mrigala]
HSYYHFGNNNNRYCHRDVLQTKKESGKHRKRGITVERRVRSVDAPFGTSKLDSPLGRMA